MVRVLCLTIKPKAQRQQLVRPKAGEPQLPLYAVFAKKMAVRHLPCCVLGNVGFKVSQIGRGIARLPSVTTRYAFEHWEDLVAYWREVLTALAQQIQEGYAAVDPKSQTERVGIVTLSRCVVFVNCGFHDAEQCLNRGVCLFGIASLDQAFRFLTGGF